MEMWKEVFKGRIPKDIYEISLQNGEMGGLIINLISKKYYVNMDFGVVSAIRMLDEGIVLNELFKDESIGEFRKQKFENIIYQIVDGEFGGFIRKIGGDLCNCFRMKHYIVITLNYVVEIITEWEPDISVIEKII